MQDQKLIESRWVIKAGKPPMRYYKLTANGTKKLNELREILGEMNKVLKGGKK
jgi:DNA-binding PadR family transcriptional regulator